jgi:hypothetical protein
MNESEAVKDSISSNAFARKTDKTSVIIAVSLKTRPMDLITLLVIVADSIKSRIGLLIRTAVSVVDSVSV